MVRKHPDLHMSTFDACRFGLASKETKTPMLKRTRIMTNAQSIDLAFAQKFCQGGHDHIQIMGKEGGISRASWAGVYPPLMVHALVDAFVADM